MLNVLLWPLQVRMQDFAGYLFLVRENRVFGGGEKVIFILSQDFPYTGGGGGLCKGCIGNSLIYLFQLFDILLIVGFINFLKSYFNAMIITLVCKRRGEINFLIFLLFKAKVDHGCINELSRKKLPMFLPVELLTLILSLSLQFERRWDFKKCKD